MRVLLTTDTIGGVWDYSVTLASALHTRGHEVLLAVFGEDPPPGGALPPGVEVETGRYRLEWMRGSSEDVGSSAAWVASLTSRWRAEIAHLHQYSCALAEFAAPTVLVAHSDVLSWFGEVQGREAPAEWEEYAVRVRAGLRRADAVVAPTEYQSRLLARHYGRPADRVIHNGSVPPPLRTVREGALLVVCAARAWDDAKGVRTLDQAVRLAGEGLPTVHLLGATVSPEGARFDARALCVHGAVGRAEVDGWMRRAAVYVAPSLYEPFGLAPLEAAQNGCALVLSDIGSFRELWDGCAAFFPPGDAEALAAVLTRLAADGEAVGRLAEGARDRARHRYTAARMSAEYLGLYADLLADRPVGRVLTSAFQPA